MSACINSYHLCYLALVEIDSRCQVGDRDRQKKETELQKKVGESSLFRM